MNPLSLMTSYARKQSFRPNRNVAAIHPRISFRSAYIPLYRNLGADKLQRASGRLEQNLSADDFLVKNPTATYFVQVTGDSMTDAGIFDGDVVVVDRAAEPSIGQIVLAEVDGEFVVRYLGQQQLTPANPTYPNIYFDTADSVALIGVVTGSMRKFT
jgi:DNA polymerase V